MTEKQKFIERMLIPAGEAIGRQHGWLVRWAVAKAGVECGWSLDNVLVTRANNCLGIHAQDGNGNAIPGVPYFTAVEGGTGNHVKYRVFVDLTECFSEFVRQLNDRSPWSVWRGEMLDEFEMVYCPWPGHTARVHDALSDVTGYLKQSSKCDPKGRLLPYWKPK